VLSLVIRPISSHCSDDRFVQKTSPAKRQWLASQTEHFPHYFMERTSTGFHFGEEKHPQNAQRTSPRLRFKKTKQTSETKVM
jgi:hypothetical protein